MAAFDYGDRRRVRELLAVADRASKASDDVPTESRARVLSIKVNDPNDTAKWTCRLCLRRPSAGGSKPIQDGVEKALRFAIKDFLTEWIPVWKKVTYSGLMDTSQFDEEALLAWVESQVSARIELQQRLLDPNLPPFDVGAAFVLAVGPDVLFMHTMPDERDVEYRYRLSRNLEEMGLANLNDAFAGFGSDSASKVDDHMARLATTPMGRTGSSIVTEVMDQLRIQHYQDWREEEGYVSQPSPRLKEAEKMAFHGLWSQVISPLLKEPFATALVLRGLLCVIFGRRSGAYEPASAPDFLMPTVRATIESEIGYISNLAHGVLGRHNAAPPSETVPPELMNAFESAQSALRTLPADAWQRIDTALRLKSNAQSWGKYRSWLHHELWQSLNDHASDPVRPHLRSGGDLPPPVRALREDPAYEPLRSELADFANLVEFFCQRTMGGGSYRLDSCSGGVLQAILDLIWCRDSGLSCGRCLTCVLLNKGVHLKQILQEIEISKIPLSVDALSSEQRLGFGPMLVGNVARQLLMNLRQERTRPTGQSLRLWGLLAEPAETLGVSIGFDDRRPGWTTIDIKARPIDFCLESDLCRLVEGKGLGLRGAIDAFLRGAPVSQHVPAEVTFTTRVASWHGVPEGAPKLSVAAIRFRAGAEPATRIEPDVNFGRQQSLALLLPSIAMDPF